MMAQLAIVGRALYSLIRDPKDGTLSHTRVGMILAGSVMTAKMVRDMPDEPQLWGIYMATVGGYAVLRQYLAGRGP